MDRQLDIKNDKNSSMPICIIAAIFAIMRMATGNTMYMAVFAAIAGGGILLAKAENKFDYIIFFSTWPDMLKFEQGSFSVFLFLAAEYCLIMILNLFTSKKKIDSNSLFVTIIFLLYVFFVSAFDVGNLNQVLGLIVNFLVVGLALVYVDERKSIHYIKLLSIGILIQGLASFLAMNGMFGQLWDFITAAGEATVLSSAGLLSRFSGFAGDPNYFAAELAFSVGCLLLLFDRTKHRSLLLLLIAVLLMFGFFTLSKMYLICAAFVLVAVICTIFKSSVRSGVFVLIVALVLTVILWEMFGYVLVEGFGARLEDASNMDLFTTGRSDIWKNYIETIFDNPLIALFGVGYGKGLLNNAGAHNGYLSMLYFFGFAGAIAFVWLLKCYVKIADKNINGEISRKKLFRIANLPMFVVLIVNLSLDAVLMDFFPMMLFMAICACNIIERKKTET